MKAIHFFQIFLLLIPGGLLFAQEDKNPVAVDDYVEVLSSQTIVIPVLENDYAWENHPMVIFVVFGGDHGTVEHSDSTITYTSDFQFEGIDSISYLIKDTENNLLSEYAQVYIDVTDHSWDMLDINQIRCRINSFGMQYTDLNWGNKFRYEVPGGSGKFVASGETSWIGGYDEQGLLHLAAEQWRGFGIDFSQGPVMDSLVYSYELDSVWNRVWKLTSDEVEYHRQHWQDAFYTPIDDIASWPGNGNVELGQAQQLAPYHDLNRNGTYDPESGDFPLIKGDMAIYVIVNDDRMNHTESGGRKLTMEVHTMYYAYNRPGDSALNHSTFCERKYINRSQNNYKDVYIGRYLNFDLGWYLDDYLCCDTTLHAAIVYNADEEDGQGESEAYGLHPPAEAFTCLNHKMDGFIYYFESDHPDPVMFPGEDYEYYNFLTGRWKDSTEITYGGSGYGGTVPVKHIFTGDPVSGTGWIEEESPFGPGDRRCVVISGPHTFNAGDTLTLVDAMVFAREYNGNHLSSVALLKTRIREIRDFYENSLGVDEEPQIEPIAEVYPNPCNKIIHINPAGPGDNKAYNYEVIDLSGKKVKSGKIQEIYQSTIDISGLKQGIYFLRLSNKNSSVTRKIIKN